MVFTDFSFLQEQGNDPALVSVMEKYPPVSVLDTWANPANDERAAEDGQLVKAESDFQTFAVVTATFARQTSDNSPVPAPRRKTRMKSYSENGAALERMVQSKARPYSVGNMYELRRVSISGCTKNKNGIWMFKVDIGTDPFDSYAVRRRFSDFKELYEGLSEELEEEEELPELPHHGVYSVFQLYFSPEPALNQRAKKLEELLQFANNHPVLSLSAPFVKFIGKNPSSLELGYVSLSSYEAPTSDGLIQFPSARSRARCQSS
ncbi:hypothetical protein Poli38472_003716 [Pythium oligandrum]|uniref:PX domain-containing protein n=1 Tax=Pythium oligandrum TaxID=41045 RepID=A0A8K1CNN7_PYTOL|nr:hypothetical protein Poli38472_003716 [Pythium oligandrum]|eukprot:TMW65951.1 hypothetical protein Poli38472_003716 [Pythium oligandrum]